MVTIEQTRFLHTPIPGPRSQELHTRRTEEVATGLGTALPVYVEAAGGAILVDADGNRLIDLASGIAVTSVGASHPAVVEAIQSQASQFTHTCFMVTQYEPATEVARILNRITPGTHEKRTALFTTGAEAVENAVKLARVYTKRSAVVTLGHAYHGRTLLTMTMTAKNVPYREGFGPYAPEVYRVPSPYPLRWTGNPERVAEEAVEQLRDIISTQIGASNVAAIVIEPIQGEGGFIVPPAGYLPAVAEFAREHGIVFIADEIQAGLGRTGAMFAVDHEGVVPDLITTAKTLGGGMPLSAVTGRREIMDAIPAGGLGGTYAANPVACAAAVAVLNAIENEDLVEAARRIEAIAMPRLRRAAESSPHVAEVRGRGAMLAIEFVEPGGLTPAPQIAKAVADACHAQGVVVLTCGTYGNVIRLLPPLVIEPALLEDGLDVLVSAIEAQS